MLPFPATGTTAAHIKRITHLGSEVQIDLILADEHQLVAHLTREQFTQLNFKKEQKVRLIYIIIVKTNKDLDFYKIIKLKNQKRN
jgi:hypothetical protein